VWIEIEASINSFRKVLVTVLRDGVD